MKKAFFSKRRDTIKDLSQRLNKSSKPKDLILLVLELQRLERQSTNTSQKMKFSELTVKAEVRVSKSLKELKQRASRAKYTRNIEEIAVEVASLNALPEAVEGQSRTLSTMVSLT